jgi:hypothetical protein
MEIASSLKSSLQGIVSRKCTTKFLYSKYESCLSYAIYHTLHFKLLIYIKGGAS